MTEAPRVLVDKFLMNIAGGDSYGLPVGPLASSVLAEAVLIDVDAALADAGFDFVRWFDDYTLFCGSDAEAQQALFFLGQWLYLNHGLTLQPAKTKILRKQSFLKGLSQDYEQRIKSRSERLHALWKEMHTGDYGEPPTLTQEQVEEIESLNLAGLLQEALSRRRGIDFEFAELILGRLATASAFSRDQALALVNIVIKHIADLYPIISSVAAFFIALDGLKPADRKRIASALLSPLATANSGLPEFVAMWILQVFASSDAWNHAQVLRVLYEKASSSVVKRYAALALATNGTRSQVLSTRQDLVGAKPLVRTAILRAWHKLGDDERKHLKRTNVIADPLEKGI